MINIRLIKKACIILSVLIATNSASAEISISSISTHDKSVAECLMGEFTFMVYSESLFEDGLESDLINNEKWIIENENKIGFLYRKDFMKLKNIIVEKNAGNPKENEPYRSIKRIESLNSRAHVNLAVIHVPLGTTENNAIMYVRKTWDLLAELSPGGSKVLMTFGFPRNNLENQSMLMLGVKNQADFENLSQLDAHKGIWINPGHMEAGSHGSLAIMAHYKSKRNKNIFSLEHISPYISIYPHAYEKKRCKDYELVIF